jgi:hypothetical protein
MTDTISFYRDAKTGQFITESEAKEKPEGTVKETHSQKSVARMSDTLNNLYQENMTLRTVLLSVSTALKDCVNTMADVLIKGEKDE